MRNLSAFRNISQNWPRVLLGTILAVYVPISNDFHSGYGVVFAQDSEPSGEEKKTRKVSGISEKTYRKFAEAQELMEADDYQGAVKVLDEVKANCEQEKSEVLAAGGLHILGTERHESRRIDNQLRGRSGRQGDPGSSRFYMCLDDDLLRIGIV